MRFTYFLRLFDSDNPVLLFHDIILWVVVILLLVFGIVVHLKRK